MNQVGPGYSWRVVYNAETKETICILDSASYTGSIYSIAEFATPEAAKEFIESEGLSMPPLQDSEFTFPA